MEFMRLKKRDKNKCDYGQCDVRRRLSMEYVKETGKLVTKKKESSFTTIHILIGLHLMGVIKISATTWPTAL